MAKALPKINDIEKTPMKEVLGEGDAPKKRRGRPKKLQTLAEVEADINLWEYQNLKKKFDKFKIIGGGYNGEKIDKEKIDFLAKLPSLDELRGKIIGLISAPAQKIASITIEPGAQIARLISSNSSNKQESN